MNGSQHSHIHISFRVRLALVWWLKYGGISNMYFNISNIFTFPEQTHNLGKKAFLNHAKSVLKTLFDRRICFK